MVTERYSIHEAELLATKYAKITSEKQFVTESTIYSWISRGYMRANKVGRKRFISQRQISDFFLQRQTGEYVDMTYANGPVR